MKKSFKTIVAFSLSLTMLISCGGADSSESTEKSGDSSSQVQDTPVEEVVYEPFTIEKLNGTWKAVDAMGYSKDKIIGQVYSFNESSATFYASYGDGGMENAELSIEGDQVVFTVKKEDPVIGGTTTMTTKYTGGFVGDQLHLVSQSEKIMLAKQ